MDMEKLKQWLDLTKQYQTESFWKEVFEQKPDIANHQQEQASAFFQQQGLFPRCDIYLEEAAIIVEAELPGLEKKDIKVLLQNQVLTITGHCHTLKPKVQYLLKERPNRKFEKQISIPSPIRKAEIRTIFENGILVIFLPIENEDPEIVDIMFDTSESS